MGSDAARLPVQHGQLREPRKDPLHNSIHGAGEQFRGPESQSAAAVPRSRDAKRTAPARDSSGAGRVRGCVARGWGRRSEPPATNQNFSSVFSCQLPSSRTTTTRRTTTTTQHGATRRPALQAPASAHHPATGRGEPWGSRHRVIGAARRLASPRGPSPVGPLPRRDHHARDVAAMLSLPPARLAPRKQDATNPQRLPGERVARSYHLHCCCNAMGNLAHARALASSSPLGSVQSTPVWMYHGSWIMARRRGPPPSLGII